MKKYIKVLFWLFVGILAVSFVVCIGLVGAAVSPIVVVSVMLYRLGAKRRPSSAKKGAKLVPMVLAALPRVEPSGKDAANG